MHKKKWVFLNTYSCFISLHKYCWSQCSCLGMWPTWVKVWMIHKRMLKISAVGMSQRAPLWPNMAVHLKKTRSNTNRDYDHVWENVSLFSWETAVQFCPLQRTSPLIYALVRIRMRLFKAKYNFLLQGRHSFHACPLHTAHTFSYFTWIA